MPYIKRPGRSISLGLATVCALFAAAVLPGLAAACPTASVSKPFQRWYDYNNYSLAPGGGFEGGSAPGWTLNGAAVAAGNESYKVHGSADSGSLAIPANATAASPSFCVSIAEPTFRFFARRTSSSWAVLYVDVRWKDSAGVVHTVNAGALSGDYSSWTPGQSLALGAMLPLWQPGTSLSVQLIFHPDPTGGNWAIDDLYIDPYSR